MINKNAKITLKDILVIVVLAWLARWAYQQLDYLRGKYFENGLDL